MKNFKKLITVITFLILSGSLIISCGDSPGNDKKNKTVKDEPSVYVKTKKLELKSFTDYISVLGVVKALNHSKLSSTEGGKIKKFVKDKGSYVKKGDVIVILDNEVLKASMDAAKAKYDIAESTYIKQKQVYDENVTSELQYLNAKYARDAAKANYELIKARYERTFIKAPFSGIVDKKFAEIGETVMPSAPIVSVVSVGKVKIEAGVPETFVNEVKKGGNVKLVFPDLDGLEINAVITFVGYTISTNNRTFPIEILINNKDGKIKPELSAKVYVEKKKYNNVFVIPEETITETDHGTVIFVENNGLAEMRNITVLSRSDNNVAVKGSVKAGDNLIVVGYQNLVNGEKVTVIN